MLTQDVSTYTSFPSREKEGSFLSSGCGGLSFPRDGRFIEILGTYNPLVDPAEIKINAERAAFWLGNGASPSDTAKELLKKAGVLDAPAAAAEAE